jgi:hypothetical protein
MIVVDNPDVIIFMGFSKLVRPHPTAPPPHTCTAHPPTPGLIFMESREHLSVYLCENLKAVEFCCPKICPCMYIGGRGGGGVIRIL